jgi:hypothetical protein
MALKIKDIEKRLHGYTENELKKLTAGSKEIYELVFQERFTVDGVLTESDATHIPVGEPVYGGRSNSCSGGMNFKTTLDVTPAQDIPVRHLNFPGFSPVKLDDMIDAKIPKYEGKSFRVAGRGTVYDRGDKIFYFDRDFKPCEDAIELAILSPGGRPARIDRSVLYGNFVKK